MIHQGMSPEEDRKDPTADFEAYASPDAEGPPNKADVEEGQSDMSSENNSSDNQTKCHDSPTNVNSQLLLPLHLPQQHPATIWIADDQTVKNTDPNKLQRP